MSKGIGKRTNMKPTLNRRDFMRAVGMGIGAQLLPKPKLKPMGLTITRIDWKTRTVYLGNLPIAFPTQAKMHEAVMDELQEPCRYTFGDGSSLKIGQVIVGV